MGINVAVVDALKWYYLNSGLSSITMTELMSEKLLANEIDEQEKMLSNLRKYIMTLMPMR